MTIESQRFVQFTRWTEPIIPITVVLLTIFFRSPFAMVLVGYLGLVMWPLVYLDRRWARRNRLDPAVMSLVVWRDGPAAYMAISVPGFPNFLLLNGPSSPVGNFSLIEVAELQFAYILQPVEQFRSGACSEICASREAMERFDAERKEAAKTTIWNSGCKSWYLDRNGLPTAWPWTFDRFRQQTSKPNLDDYEMRHQEPA